MFADISSRLAAGLVAVALSTPALAGGPSSACRDSNLAKWMTADVAAKTAEERDLDVFGVFTVGAYYEVQAAAKNGRRVLVYLDPVTGQVVGTRSRTRLTIAGRTPACTAVTPAVKGWVGSDAVYRAAKARDLDVRGVRVVGAVYEVHAVDTDGRRVLAYFDPVTAKQVAKHPLPARIQTRRSARTVRAVF